MNKLLIVTLLMLVASAATAQKISSASYIVVDLNGTVLLEKDADQPRPIASITKLVTAQRAVKVDPLEIIEITKEDVSAARAQRISPLRAGMKFTRQELTELALVNSDNIAAIALDRVAREHQVEIDLPPNTQIVEGSGLNPENKSTARDLARLAIDLYDTELAQISTKPEVSVGKIRVRNTNRMIEAPGWDFYLSKTGFIKAAGSCLVTVTQVKDRAVAIVLLGAPSSSARWQDLYAIRKAFDDGNYANPQPTVAKKQRVVKKKRKV